MKRSKRWILIAVLMAAAVVSAPAGAATDGGPVRKLGRGFGNLTTGWLELGTQIMQTTEKSGSWAGATVGFARGLVFGVGRTLVGAIELVTFPIPNPTTGYGPVIEPEFVKLRDADRW
jgi:putative exosortase-associated protein (TIGR04073 family)